MNNDVELEGRPRPLSTGLWTLFSWLRRDDRSDSSESLSSAGSDRTVASFSFLTPAHYQPVSTPLVLPPPGPPTDSYKKRVHDRNLRRQYDRDITLHRKYGLFKSGESTCGYDAFSLPPVRRINGDSSSRWDRERRATSECYQRRLAHVPGKRRAPLPPTATAPIVSTTSLTRRSTRKRRAPQPPVKVVDKNKENLKTIEVNTILTQMNPQSYQEKQKLRNNDVTMGCKSEKYSKKEGYSKDTKVKTEKSFLKQIFDSKKRNSGVDISSVKLLPSISELDKQAAEIIETCKLNASEQNNNIRKIKLENVDAQRYGQPEAWICVSCLRKYNSSIITCLYCLPRQKINATDPDSSRRSLTSKASNNYTQTESNQTKSVSNSANKNAAEEKQKLKEMLKEMKDSLPKRPKHDIINKSKINSGDITKDRNTSYSTETPTLRVGSTVEPSTSSNIAKSQVVDTGPINRMQSPVTIQPAPIVRIMPDYKNNSKMINVETEANIINIKPREDATITNIQNANEIKSSRNDILEPYKDKKDLHTPLKISSLLNPVYVPKNSVTNKPQITETSQTEPKIEIQHPFVKPTQENIKRVIQTASNSNRITDAVPVISPSTSQGSRLPVNINKIEIKTKTEYDKNITESPRGNNLAKTNKALEIKHSDKKILPSSTKEQIILKDNITQDQHSRRRDLIQQLEQSIAKGDERAAAEAAAKLAQLKLSCSVLSFSSQILSQPSTSTTNEKTQVDEAHSNKVSAKVSTTNENNNKESGVQLSSVIEKLPQKVDVRNVKSSSGLVKTNLTTISETNDKSVQDKPIQKSNASIIQKVGPEVKKNNTTTNDNMTTISVLVEDREATRGPIHLRINRQALMRDLRREAETSLGLASNLQRWIVGRVLCVNDDTPIISLAGSEFNAPFYLCVVESETKSDKTSTPTKIVNNEKPNLQTNGGNVYTELVQLEQRALVPNAEHFECGVCMEEYTPGGGVVLRECVHIFCKECLSDVVRHCEEPDIPCPAMGCRGMLQEREIRALVTPEDYERWLARGLAAAESGTRNAFHCRTRDCKGWALCEPGVQRFPCPVCKHINCVPCQAIHDGKTCDQHRAKLKQAAAGKSAHETDDGTRTLLNSLIAKGEALECPECSAIITKKWGCDWVKCSACKTEICWVTRGRRWGPSGKGDTSGGCRCGVDGRRCHPSCGYCH